MTFIMHKELFNSESVTKKSSPKASSLSFPVYESNKAFHWRTNRACGLVFTAVIKTAQDYKAVKEILRAGETKSVP